MLEFFKKIRMPAMARRINRKVNTLVKKFGYDSPMAQDLMADIITTVPSENIVYKNGVPQIRKPINLARKDIDLTALDKVKGYGQLKKEYEGKYEMYRYEMEFMAEDADGQELPTYDLIEFIKKSMSINDILSKVKSISGSGATNETENEIIGIMKNPIKTYQDLFRVGELLNGI